ncbi:hypothetical protein IMPR6_240006 [Imperialibacter sp. EC-SDR9]|nr:hypothetical protein IMPERIA75_460078 [Imperialibacter sp. 75]CAD5288454.1 hypothetical protein IMPERIA89_590006 [Imperialibacter sp. 89]VVT15904.1 hypothetical protein IMPR6_240006 [Imperialibacter sp. EC-SDR9]
MNAKTLKNLSDIRGQCRSVIEQLTLVERIRSPVLNDYKVLEGKNGAHLPQTTSRL